MQESFYGDTNIQNQKQQVFARLEAMKETAIQREKENSDLKKFEAYREKVKSTVINLVSSGTAPWLKGHDGNTELSYFPETQYVPQGFTAVWLKIREQELGSNDPRWYSRKDVFSHGYHIGHNQKATIMSFRGSDDSIKYNYYWNASQLSGIPPYEKSYTVSTNPPEIYRPRTIGHGNDKSYHPQETLRADITNYLVSVQTHTPYEPKGLNRIQQVKDYLEKSNSGTFFFTAKTASETAKKMIGTFSERAKQQEQTNERTSTVER